ncbi:hypothetical protein SKAU_G00259270 [Synaphobranchus kaupii]|uniref:Uncharacterized protein n=1 Tax=Synaphobranchus kaupii TaxID=118154 RepID=A0A9Q1ISQ2_SYNKA|nr:hypothetical protein SKAU_G00259270 [Synaphobranchus kaupii]
MGPGVNSKVELAQGSLDRRVSNRNRASSNAGPTSDLVSLRSDRAFLGSRSHQPTASVAKLAERSRDAFAEDPSGLLR